MNHLTNNNPGDIIKKYLILIAIISILLLITPLSAADSNNDTQDTIITSDEPPTMNNDSADVYLITEGEYYGIYGNKETPLLVLAIDENFNNINEGALTFIDVFGENYTVPVIDGYGSCYIFVNETGTFNITCKYIGTDKYKNNTTTLILNIPVANTTCHNIVATKYDNCVYFTGNVVSDYNNIKNYNDYEEVTEGNLTVYIDGEKAGMCKVDENGNFLYIWNTTRNLIGQTVNFTAYFTNKLKHFNPSNFSKSFTFTTAKNTEILLDTTNIGNDIQIHGDIKDENGENVIGGTLTVNNQYNIPVDTNGEFIFYITNQTQNKINYEIGVMDWGSKADITANIPLMNGIEHTDLTDQLIDLCKQGSPYIKFGNGNGKTIVLNIGIHGCELAPQVAGLKLINLLASYGNEINGTIYIFPFTFPESIANNERMVNHTNMNAVANINGTVSNNLVKFAKSINASGLGDFHGTRHSDSDVGATCIMCTHNPTNESYLIAEYIADETGYLIKDYERAGSPYLGAIEDECNLNGIPAVTCEVLSNHKSFEYGSPEVSLNMMKSFLSYFGFYIDEMIKINPQSKTLSLMFTSPYNYNSSMKSIDLIKTALITAKPASYIINYGGKYSITLKDSKGNPIVGKKVTFALNGKYIGSATTKSKGIATFTLTPKILKTAKYGKKNLIIKFSASYYKSTSKTVKITISKEKTKISAKSKTFKKSVKTKKVAAILKNSKGKAIKNVKLTLKVKGKTYKAKTNSKGKAIFKIVKLTKKGTFKAKINFVANSYYKSVTKTIKIKIK